MGSSPPARLGAGFCIPLYDAGRTLSQREEAGRMYPEEVRLLNCVLRCLAFLAPLPRPLTTEKTRRLLHH